MPRSRGTVSPYFPFPMWMASRPVPRREWGRPDLISQEEARFTLGISRTTLWRLVKAGDLDAVSIGSRTLIARASLDAYITRNLNRRGNS